MKRFFKFFLSLSLAFCTLFAMPLGVSADYSNVTDYPFLSNLFTKNSSGKYYFDISDYNCSSDMYDVYNDILKNYNDGNSIVLLFLWDDRIQLCSFDAPSFLCKISGTTLFIYSDEQKVQTFVPSDKSVRFTIHSNHTVRIPLNSLETKNMFFGLQSHFLNMKI